MHWIAVVPHQHVSAHDTKTEAIKQIANLLIGQSRTVREAVRNQLERSKGATVAYGVESEEIAKVLPCNCGSLQKHRR